MSRDKLQRIVRGTNKVLSFVMSMFMLVVMLVGLYAMYDSKLVLSESSSCSWEAYRPSEGKSLGFDELRDINPEVWGWISLYGTHIDNPLLYCPDSNVKYLNTDAEGNYSLGGSIFVEQPNQICFRDFNTLVFGHHMDKGMMFGDLDLYKDESFMKDHVYGSVSYVEDSDELVNKGLKVLGLISTDAYDEMVYQRPLVSKHSQSQYVSYLLNHMAVVSGMPYTLGKLALLSTCSSDSTNGRIVLVCELVDEIEPNHYQTNKQVNVGSGLDDTDGGLGEFVVVGGSSVVLIYIALLLNKQRKQMADECGIDE